MNKRVDTKEASIKTVKGKKTKVFSEIASFAPVILLGFIDTVMVLIPTYLENYLPGLYQYIHLEPGQYTQGLGWYGIFMLLMNFIGAPLAGKFKGTSLIKWGLVVQIIVMIWYTTLMFQPVTSQALLIQWIFILLLISFSINAFIWSPMWRIIKNHGTNDLVGKEKESKVARNNGIAGISDAVLGIVLAGVGALLVAMEQTWHLWDPITITNIHAKAGTQTISIAFLCLIGMAFVVMIFSLVASFKIFKDVEDDVSKTFSTKNAFKTTIINWKMWALGFLVLGIFMLQMELSAYINYLKFSLLITAGVVTIFGIIRTYIMRFLLAGFAAKFGDRTHSYIFVLNVGLFLGIILIIVAACLPGAFDSSAQTLSAFGYSHGVNTFIQVIGMANLVVLGGLTWTLVTLRWSPIGTELGIQNNQYGTAIAFVSALGFSPGIYFKFIKGAIETKYTVIGEEGVKFVTIFGNQMILLTCAGIAFLGLIAGLILYINLHRKSPLYKFRFVQSASKRKELNEQYILANPDFTMPVKKAKISKTAKD